MLFGVLLIMVYVLWILDVEALGEMDTPIWQVLIGLFLLIILPFSVYRLASKNYKAHDLLNKPVDYEFSKEQMKVTTESLYAEFELKKIFKIEELNNWFLFYQNESSASFIFKPCMEQGQIKELRSLLTDLKIKKIKLKTT